MLELKDKYNSEEINKYVNEGLINYPTHPEIWFVKGLAEKAQNNTLAAIESFGKAISLNKSFDLLLNNGFPGNEEQAYFELATLSASVGDHVNALEHYFEVLKINKRNTDALAGLYELIKDQQPAEIIFFLNSIYDKENKDDLSFLNAVMVELGNSVLANYYYMQHEGS